MLKINPIKINDILITSVSFSGCLSALYKYYKEIDSSFTMAHICDMIDMPSTGYLSDVMKGKRTLHEKYVPTIHKPFRLNPLQKKCLNQLAKYQLSETLEAKNNIELQLLKTKKELSISFGRIDLVAKDLNLTFEVYAAFGLFQNKVKLEDLVNFFSNISTEQIEDCLQALILMNIVEAKENYFILKKNHVIFNNSSDGFSHLDFIRTSIDRGKNAVSEWFDDSQKSIFISEIISVTQKNYQKVISELRAELKETRSVLNSDLADSIIRFNVQIYPIVLKRS